MTRRIEKLSEETAPCPSPEMTKPENEHLLYKDTQAKRRS